MLCVRVLGAAAGGGFPQWNANSEACRRARAGDPAAKPATQASIAVSADERRWFIINASPDLAPADRSQSMSAADGRPALEPDRRRRADQRRRRCDRRPAASSRGNAVRALCAPGRAEGSGRQSGLRGGGPNGRAAPAARARRVAAASLRRRRRERHRGAAHSRSRERCRSISEGGAERGRNVRGRRLHARA